MACIIAIILIHGICCVLETRALTASHTSATWARGMRPMGPLLPHLRDSPPLVVWHISAPLTQQEPTQKRPRRKRCIHVLYGLENLKFCLWGKRKVKDIHKISGSVRRRTCLFCSVLQARYLRHLTAKINPRERYEKASRGDMPHCKKPNI